MANIQNCLICILKIAFVQYSEGIAQCPSGVVFTMIIYECNMNALHDIQLPKPTATDCPEIEQIAGSVWKRVVQRRPHTRLP